MQHNKQLKGTQLCVGDEAQIRGQGTRAFLNQKVQRKCACRDVGFACGGKATNIAQSSLCASSRVPKLKTAVDKGIEKQFICLR